MLLPQQVKRCGVAAAAIAADEVTAGFAVEVVAMVVDETVMAGEDEVADAAAAVIVVLVVLAAAAVVAPVEAVGLAAAPAAFGNGEWSGPEVLEMLAVQIASFAACLSGMVASGKPLLLASLQLVPMKSPMELLRLVQRTDVYPMLQLEPRWRLERV
jgi:hypothetical protein